MTARSRIDPIDGGPPSVVRRAPFSDNPKVGARGQKAQQRILDAALQVFGEDGYHDCGVIRITELAGCSRAAFYQYFSSKEDVFRHLAGEVARELLASTNAIHAVTPDAGGWHELRAWVERHGDIYARYEPVFRAFQAAAESDVALASGASRIADRNVAALRSKLSEPTLPARHVDPVISLLVECMSRSHHIVRVLQAALPPSAYPRSGVDDALADVFHRTLFGLDAEVNVQAPPRRRVPHIPMDRQLADDLEVRDAAGDLSATGARTLQALLKAGRDVLVTRGYHGTRVDDVAAAAGVSHGAFYRYFENKDHLVRVLAINAMQSMARAFFDIPEGGGAELRQWLKRYNAAYGAETAMMRVWVDANASRPQSDASAAAIDWGRQRIVRFLRPRGFGDVDTEALLMVALVDAFGARRGERALVEAAALIIERGLLGVSPRR